MNDINWQPELDRILQALGSNDMQRAAVLIRDLTHKYADPIPGWRNITKISLAIGEVGLALTAAKRFASVEPANPERIFYYATVCAECGRHDDALDQLNRLPKQILNDPRVLHFKGTLCLQTNKTSEAEACFRSALKQQPLLGDTWYSLVSLKKTSSEDLSAMKGILNTPHNVSPESQTALLYAIGNAEHDAEHYDKAFSFYERGAANMRLIRPYDGQADWAGAQKIIKDQTREKLKSVPSATCDSSRPIFVMGSPRSGTTLVEQIIAAHSSVVSGGEMNLFKLAMRPVKQPLINDVKALTNSCYKDYFNRVNETYYHLAYSRLNTESRFVDKTLNHTRYFGFLQKTFPKAKFIWVKRSSADTALSCFRTYFPRSLNWSWSLKAIAEHFNAEEELFQHWMALFPHKLFVINYDDLVSQSQTTIEALLQYCDLPFEEDVLDFHKQTGVVTTASVAQVRHPISSSSVGGWKRYTEHFSPFWSTLSELGT